MPSSVIRRFAYNETEQELRVEFTTGREYLYSHVPSDVAEAFRAAFSKGTYFNARIRDHFPFCQVARQREDETQS